MQCVRIIGNYYHKGKKRFTFRCFANAKDQSISVLSGECISETYLTSVCFHIRKFYSSSPGKHPIGHLPIVYWLFDSSILCPQVSIEKQENPCNCHYVIKNLTNMEAKSIYENELNHGRVAIRICSDDNQEHKFNPENDHISMLGKKAN